MSNVKTGFTLIEILVVLAIGALVFIGGYAGYRDFTRRQILEGSSEETKSNLALARQRALSGEKPSGCTEDLSGYRVSMTFSDPSGNSSYTISAMCTQSGISTGTTNLPVGITLSAPQSQFLFKSIGQGTDLSSDLIITLTQGSTGAQSTITVTSGGAIK